MFDKPKVTIDLDEYNELLSFKSHVSGDEYMSMAKEVIAVLLNNKLNNIDASYQLKHKGILFSYSSINNTRGYLNAEDIYILKIEK